MIELEPVFLTRARESLAGAEAEFTSNRFNNCANRAYYACFLAAVHALTHSGARPPGSRGQWEHDVVQAQLVGLLINRRKIYPAHFRDTLMRSFALRRAADYGRELVGQRQARRALQRAVELVNAVASVDGAET